MVNNGKYMFTVFDVESYPNYFCFVAMDFDRFGNKLDTYFIQSDNERITKDMVEQIDMILDGSNRDYKGYEYDQYEPDVHATSGDSGRFEHYIISFNGAKFDLPLLAKLRRDVYKVGMTTTRFVCKHRDELITFDKSNNRMTRAFYMNKDWNRKHYDMLTNCLLSKSLKQWEMYTNQDIRELPIDPNKELDENETFTILEYCAYDVQALSNLFFKLGYTKSISGKPTFSAYRELFLRLPPLLQDRFDRTPSKLAVGSVYHDLSSITPVTMNPFDKFDITVFNTPNEVKQLIFSIEHSPPDIRKETNYTFNGIDYGTGGAHFIRKGFTPNVISYDVASMYPTILIIWQMIKTMEARKRYEQFKIERIVAKKSNNSALNEGLKLALNSFSGELRSKSPYLASYDPAAGNAMCYIGQLLISEFVYAVDPSLWVEVNTDGAMFENLRMVKEILDRVAENMKNKYGMVFESELYDYVYARDVNNYCIYDSEGNFVKAKGDRWSDYNYKGHILAVTKELFKHLIQDSLSLDWKQYEWTDYIYKYHKSAASKYATIDGEPMRHKNYYFLWTKTNCPNAQNVTFSRDLINKKNGSLKCRYGVWSQSVDELSKYSSYIDYDQYHRELDDDFELWGRDDLCTTRIPKEQIKLVAKSLSDFFPAM